METTTKAIRANSGVTEFETSPVYRGWKHDENSYPIIRLYNMTFETSPVYRGQKLYKCS